MFGDLSTKEKIALAVMGGAAAYFVYCKYSSRREGYSHNAGMGSCSAGSHTIHHLGDESTIAQEETYDSPASAEFIDADDVTGVRENFTASEVNVIPGQQLPGGNGEGCGINHILTTNDMATAHSNQVANAVYYTTTPFTTRSLTKMGKYGKENSNSHLKMALGFDLATTIARNQHPNLCLVGKTQHGYNAAHYSGLTGQSVHGLSTVGAHRSTHLVNLSTTPGSYGIHM